MSDQPKIDVVHYEAFAEAFQTRADEAGIRIGAISKSTTLGYPPKCLAKVGIQTDAVDACIDVLADMGYPESSHHIVWGRGHIVVVNLAVRGPDA